MPVAGTFCVPCFFLPEVLYQVHYEMGLCSCFKLSNAYLHSRNNLFCLANAISYEWTCLHLSTRITSWKERFMFDRLLWQSNLQCFHCLLQVWGKDWKLRLFACRGVKLRQICVCTRTTYPLNLRILLNPRFSQDSLVESLMQNLGFRRILRFNRGRLA